MYIALLAFATVCNAGCYLKPLLLTDFMHPPKGCQDEDGELHDFMAEWNKHCYECVCFHHGAICCDTINIAVAHSPECEAVVDRQACTSKVVLKSDKTKECV
ncbi:beta-microseminoprotein-like [Anguilla anguilla]|uniref:beta-microseminoprotein-like n=1 Tax=Anguilla anguilla TaxID=7936 RepID=UPI0015AF8DD0|nr:beta-microseminoprotein-like [Anguilla anguilla]